MPTELPTDRHQPSVLVNATDAKRRTAPCIEVRFDGRYDARAGMPYVLLTAAGAQALENDLRRARLAAADMVPVDATIYPSDEITQLAVAAGVDPDRAADDVFTALLARVKQLNDDAPF